MPYKVHFVGLVCFYKESGARQALLPDGEHSPPAGVDPHYGSILVAPEAIEQSSGWSSDVDTARGIFYVPPCSIAIEGMDAPGVLDTSAHDNLLPQLRQIDPDFEIDPDQAETIARLHIRQGTLSARTISGGSAAISQLIVPHDGAFTITVTPRDGSAARTLRMAAGAEVVIGNMARGGSYARAVPLEENNHFRIYEKLSIRPVTLSEPASVQTFSQPESQHWFFVDQGPINLHTSCSNTGCCQ